MAIHRHRIYLLKLGISGEVNQILRQQEIMLLPEKPRNILLICSITHSREKDWVVKPCVKRQFNFAESAKSFLHGSCSRKLKRFVLLASYFVPA